MIKHYAIITVILWCSPFFGLQGAQAGGIDTEVRCSVNITTACLAWLARDLTALPLGTTQADRLKGVTSAVNSFVHTCIDSNGTMLRPIRILAASEAAPIMESLALLFANRTGYQVVFDYVSVRAIALEILNDLQNSLRIRDGWFVTPLLLAPLQYAGAAVPLDKFIAADTDLSWTDVLPFFRDTSSVYNGQVMGMTISGKISMVYYRADVFAAAGLDVPATWDDFLATAQALNGTDFNGDNQGDYALCWQLTSCDGGVLLGQMLAPTTQVTSLKQGWLIDPTSMAPLIGSAAGARALSMYQSLIPYAWPNRECSLSQQRLVSGECALTIRWDEQFKFARTSAFTDMIRFAPLPGSEHVLNRNSGQLVKCTSLAVCPNAEVRSWPNGTTRYINRAPYYGQGGIAGVLNARQPTDYQQATYDFFSFVASQEMSLLSVTSLVSIDGPFRYSHLLSNATARAAWAANGYNMTTTAAYLQEYTRGATSNNIALDMRFLGATEASGALMEAAAMLLGGSSTQAVQTWLHTSLRRILNSSTNGGAAMVQASYWASLGIKTFKIPGLLDAGTGTGILTIDQNKDGLGAGAITGIAAAVGGIAAIASACVLLLLLRRRRLSLWGKARPPRVGLMSTLLVTDIENSTGLWESLSQETMNLAIELHHELIRALLRKHYGYESATEGDSFIAAFHNPEDAVCFSCALQRDMLDLPWPDELLEHASGAAVWATQAAVARGMTVTKSQLQLQVQNHEGSIPSLQAPQAGKPRGKPVPGFALLRHLLQRRSRSPTQPQPQGSTPLIHSLSHKHFGCISHVDVATTFDAERSTLNSPAVGTASHLIVSPGTSPRVEGTSPRAETNGLTTSGSTPQHVGLGAWAAVRESATAGWLAHDIAVAGPSMSCSVHQFYCEHYSVVEAVATPSHPGGGAQGSSHSHGTRSMHGANRRGRILFRGLRVRVGIHCGIHSPADVVDNKISGRVEYSGAPMALAKAVGDVGHGGMVLLSGDALAALPPPALPKLGLILNLGDVRFKKDAELPPTTVYQVVPPELEGRIALCPNTLRGTEMLAVGVLSAPLGTVAVSFVKLVGASTLLAWNREQGMEALEVFQKHAVTSLAKQSSGYLVELAGGLALAAFGQPAHALQFGVALIAGLQHADWNEELLAHELCEEVRVAQRPVAESSEAAGGGTHRQDTSISSLRTSLADITLDATGLTNNPATSPMLAMVAAGSGLSLPPPVPSVLYAAASLPRSIMSSMQNPDLPGLHHGHSAGLLFRGPRLKLGVDVGQVHAAISPATGRMGYRGRVMNRAARIAEKAGSGQVWCSTAVWEAAGGDYALAELGIEGSPLGQLPFKGLMEPIDVVHARAVYRLQPMPCVPATQTAATRAASVSHAHALGPPDSNSHSSSLRLIPRPAVLRAESWRASRVHEWSQACGCAPRAASSDHYAVSAPPGSGMSVAAQMEHPAGQTGARTDATPHMVRPMTVLELLPAHPRPSGPHARGMATPFMGAPASATGTAKPSSACNAAPSASTAVLPNSASGAGHVTPGVRTPVPMYHSMPEPGVPGNSLLQRVVSTITGSRLQPIPPRASDVPDGMLGGALWAADGEAGVEAGSQQSTVATFQGMQI